MKRVLFAILLAGLLAAASPVNAAIITLTASLAGSNEVPANASPGTGSGTFTLDDVADTLFVSVSFSGLTSTDTAAHIHCCVTPGANAAVALSFTGFGFPTGVTSGTFTHTFNLATDLTGITPAAFIAGFESFQTYTNIHTTNFPGGEIRGQIVPEPATLGLLALGFSVVTVVRRRKVKA